MCVLESQENSMNTWIIIHEEEKGVMKDSIRCDEVMNVESLESSINTRDNGHKEDKDVMKESIRFDEDF